MNSIFSMVSYINLSLTSNRHTYILIMPSPILLSLLLLLPLLCLFLATRVRKKANTNKPNLPPGPTNLPFIGNLHKLGLLPHKSLFRLSQKHGPLMYLKLGTVPTVVASSADTAKELLTTHDLETCSRPRLTSLHRLSYGSNDIACAPYGQQWRVLRKVCVVELFSTKKVLSFRPIREEEVRHMIGNISDQSINAVNMSEELVSLANHIICRTALGKRYYNTGDGGSLKRILGETEALFMGFFFADYIPMLGWLDRLTGMRDRLERNFQDLDGFCQRVLDDHVNAVRTEEEDRAEDAIDTLLDIQKNGTHLTNEHIKGVLMNIFVAGSETSSTTIEWVLVELMRNPSVMKKAQDEVRSVVGSKGEVGEIDLDHLNYLRCIVKETMRLHPSIPLLLPRETIQYCRIAGYDIPPRTRLLINSFAIGRDANVWNHPDKFDPERFTDSSIDFKGYDFELIPFGAGRRICPGMNFGMLAVELALANLLYSFNWELPAGMSKEEIDMDEAPGIAVHRKSDLYLVAKRYK